MDSDKWVRYFSYLEEKQQFFFFFYGFEETYHFDCAETALMLPFLYMQVLANFLSAPLASGIDGGFVGWPYVAFDLNVSVVKVRNF